jgi:hypothetical protein
MATEALTSGERIKQHGLADPTRPDQQAEPVLVFDEEGESGERFDLRRAAKVTLPVFAEVERWPLKAPVLSVH